MPGMAMIEKLDAPELTTSSGIVLSTENIVGELVRGKVVAYSPHKDSNVNIKEGTVVLLKRYGPEIVKVDSIEYLLAEVPQDIVGIVTDPKFYPQQDV